MSGVPSIPPLLCNTPPPIDFGEEDDDSGLPPTLALEDDEFGDFNFVTDINENARYVDETSLPHTPLRFELSSSTTSGFRDIPTAYDENGTVLNIPTTNEAILKNNEVQKEEISKLPLKEAYNFILKNYVSKDNSHLQCIDTQEKETPEQDILDDNEQSKINCNDVKIIAHSQKSDIESTSKTSSPKVTNFESVGKSRKEPEAGANILTDNILLEDLTDDNSDNECNHSPKNFLYSPTSSLACNDINSDDFFAIYVVGETPSSSSKEDKPTPTLEDINMNKFSNYNNNIIKEPNNTEDANVIDTTERDNDFGNFADFNKASEHMEPTNLAGTEPSSETVAAKALSNESSIATDELYVDNGALTNDADDDFDDFQDFCTAATKTTTSPVISTNTMSDMSTKINVNRIVDDVGVTEISSPTSSIVKVAKTVEDEDDFGDFEEASFDTPPLAPNTNSHASVVTYDNINERLGTVLKQLFPTISDYVAGDDIETKKEIQVKTLPGFQSEGSTLPFETIETAKALQFQWPQSEMRHSLIRSIGIDSRNILFGENWNPSMPRFAANLSFNPLKPMKPQTTNISNMTSTSGSGATVADVDSMQYSTSNSDTYIKTDVPDVDLDWQNTALTNPLDGIEGETDTGETETIYSSPSITRFDTSDEQHQSHTTTTNIDDCNSETLSNNNTAEMISPLRDVCLTPLPLDTTVSNTFIVHDSSMTSSSSSSNNKSCTNSITSSCSKTYDNSKILTTLHLGANTMNNDHAKVDNVDVDDDDNDDDDVDEDETIVTSTYAGPLKETHIYTPSKTDIIINKLLTNNNKAIDFDYEIAAAGIIINEKVVKKEYRDVEYNPGFGLEVVNEYAEELNVSEPSRLPLAAQQRELHTENMKIKFDNDEFTEFTQFQPVPPTAHQIALPRDITTFGTTNNTSTIITPTKQVELNTKPINNCITPVLPVAVAKAKESSNTPSRTNSPSIIDNMILSPAILLPQAIPIGTNSTMANKPSAPAIEWGDSTANIDPDELARIEELFPQPKMLTANSTQKSTPTHTYTEKQVQIAATTISASVALKEQDSTLNDDYWSEFVSVPVMPQQLPSHSSRLNNNKNKNNSNSTNSSSSSSNNNNYNKNNNNHNQSVITPKRVVNVHANDSNNTVQSLYQQQTQSNIQRTLTPTPQLQKENIIHRANTPIGNVVANSTYTYNNSNNINNDDDWSDFVSNTPAAPTTASNHHNITATAHMPQFNSAAWQNANFYNNPLGLYHQQTNMHHTRTTSLTPQQQQLQLQQQIHIMQDFSTAPTIATRPNIATQNNSNIMNNMQQNSNLYSPLQVGNARVAPSVSLIPDLGFVAPAIPVHTAFVNVLPKTSFNSKK